MYFGVNDDYEVVGLKQTKKLHPIVFIGFSALVGIVFRYAGV